MNEGLFVCEVLQPDHPDYDIRHLVMMIDNNRLFGGNQGYHIIGNLDHAGNSTWRVSADAIRHNTDITTIFGDEGKYAFTGMLSMEGTDASGRPLFFLIANEVISQAEVKVSMIKVSDLT